MALDWPDDPAVGDIYDGGATTWQWDGTSWNLVAPGGSGTGTDHDHGHLHTQALAAATWTIRHGLGRRPLVQLATDDGEVVHADVVHLDLNTALVAFAQPATGTARLV